MRRGSVKRPLLIYCMVFMLGLGLAIVTYASIALVRTSNNVHQASLLQEAQRLADSDPFEQVVLYTRARKNRLPQLSVVTATTGPISIEEARGEVGRTQTDSGWLSVPLRGGREEAYLVFRPTARPAMRAVQSEIGTLMLFGVAASIAGALLLAFLVIRLLLPQLSTLQKVAQDSLGADSGLMPGDAPNEIAEIARAFRSNVRRLREEQAMIERQHNRLERMQTSLVRASKLAGVGRLAAGIAHEIGNPLSAVLGYLSLLKTDLDDAERADILDRTSKQLRRIHETIRKLLTYARPDDEDTPKEPLSTHAVLEETLFLLRSHPALRDITLTSEVPPSNGPDAIGHAGPLGQVLVNLVLNAGHALAGVENGQIRIGSSPRDHLVVLEVSDNGPGISREDMEHIFDPFFTTKPVGEGTGLGLAVSRALMERMDGDLTVRSTPGEGATFRVVLPANEGDNVEPPS